MGETPGQDRRGGLGCEVRLTSWPNNAFSFPFSSKDSPTYPCSKQYLSLWPKYYDTHIEPVKACQCDSRGPEFKSRLHNYYYHPH